ncbi:AAA family ATPase [Flavobacterium chryseum]|uniref:AAA family ATPase n=1 Tax=Flavobacterium sp. P3160 TaxID=2512113 RepID=UPI00105F474E
MGIYISILCLVKMHINNIKIEEFRNLKDSQIEFNEGVDAISGHNYTGKTNLFSAMSLL